MATCTCGWYGPERAFVQRATKDAVEHMTTFDHWNAASGRD
jgi:hypothetical protein